MTKSLSEKINFPVVFRVMGLLLIIEAVFMLIPLAISWYFNEMQVVESFTASSAITLGTGALMAFGIRPHSRVMRSREGLFLTAIIWVFFSIFGMLPYLFSGALPSLTDAFFETMSGFTTTGSSVIRDVESVPHGVLFWRSFTQWIGGLGIILFTLAVIPMLNNKGGISLFNSEVTGITHEKLRPRVSQTAKGLWKMYISFTVVLTVLLLFSPLPWFDALCHALSTTSTGGFSTKNAGLGFWHSYYADSVIMLFMVICGMSFPLIYATIRGDFKRILTSDTFKCYLLIIVVASAVIVARMFQKGFCDNHSDRYLYAVFDTISAVTSTGYSTFDYESVGEFISILLVCIMFFGGMAGGTSGGAKIDRLIVMFKYAQNELYRVLHPNSVKAIHVDGRAITPVMASKVVAFLTIYMFILIAVAVALAFFGLPMMDALFTSMSMISNVGLGYGMTGVEQVVVDGVTVQGGFFLLPCLAKWMLSFEMLVGRLEIFTVLVIFTRSFWKKD